MHGPKIIALITVLISNIFYTSPVFATLDHWLAFKAVYPQYRYKLGREDCNTCHKPKSEGYSTENLNNYGRDLKKELGTAQSPELYAKALRKIANKPSKVSKKTYADLIGANRPPGSRNKFEDTWNALFKRTHSVPESESENKTKNNNTSSSLLEQDSPSQNESSAPSGAQTSQAK